MKKNAKTGAEKKVILEHALGFFWAFKVGIYAAFDFASLCVCIK